MTAVSAKKVEGILQEINPTTIQIDGKTIYLPRGKRDDVTAMKLVVGERVFCVYSISGDLISIDRRTPIIDAEKEQKVHIQEQAGPIRAESSGETRPATPLAAGNETMHMQEENAVQQPATSSPPQPEIYQTQKYVQMPAKDWIPERERHDTIVWQSVLARAVEIVNANYTDFPQLVRETDPNDKEAFVNILDARCNLIERVSERFYGFVKKKVDLMEELEHGT